MIYFYMEDKEKLVLFYGEGYWDFQIFGVDMRV